MDNITPITTMVEDAKERMLHKLQSTDLAAMQEIMVRPFQDIENEIWVFFEALKLENATGQILEWYGKLVGMPKPLTGPASYNDNSYRVLIYGKIAENRSHGTIEDGYQILRALLLTSPRIYRVYPYSWTVNYINTSLTLACNCIRYILERATGPIDLDITAHSGTPFGFVGDLTALGFGAGEIGEAG